MRSICTVALVFVLLRMGMVEVPSQSGLITSPQVKLITPAVYLPGVPVLVRVEVLNRLNERDRELWNAEVALSVDDPLVVLSTNRIRLYNGLGSAFVNCSGGADFKLTAALGSAEATRVLRSVAGETRANVGGTLAGTATTWSGVVHVTSDVTVPVGHTLTLESNTLVLIDGVASGTTAPDLLVNGTIRSLGTEAHPVTITCASATLRFGEIRHTSAQPSLYRHTSISRGGRSAGVGHTGGFGGPLFRLNNSRVVFESSNLTDNSGKLMQATGSDLVFDDCLLARAIMGPEIEGTALLCTNTYIMEMSSADDGDGIYLHGAGNRAITLTGCVLAGLTGNADDGIDTLDADVTIEDCIIRDWFHTNPAEDPKGISVFNRTVVLRRCLIEDNFIGINAKSYAPPSFARVIIEHCTIGGLSTAVAAGIKGNAPGPAIALFITNSILHGPDAIRSDFDPLGLTNFAISYTALSEAAAGVGNVAADPRFVNLGGRDFHLQPYSPCIDAGNPASPVDPDGSLTDLGCFRFLPPAPALAGRLVAQNGATQFTLTSYTNRHYTLEVSTNMSRWEFLQTVWPVTEATLLSDPAAAGQPRRFYRARLGP